MCDDAYVAGLCSREGIAPGAANPFITFGFDSDMVIEVVVLDSPACKGTEEDIGHGAVGHPS